MPERTADQGGEHGPIRVTGETETMTKEQLEQYGQRVLVAMEYINKIVVESDGYPMLHEAHEIRTLLINAFLAGQDSMKAEAHD